MAGNEKVVQLHLDGGKKPKLKARKRRIGPEQDETFFSTLAASCNVTLSARAAGISPQRCYARRREDAGYRQRWEQALSEGYAKLEMALLERAIAGSEKVTTYKDGSKSVVHEYPNALAMNLLKMHRDTAREADYEVAEEDVSEVRARIAQKLDRLGDKLRARGALDAKDGGAQER